jgi:hypothetical protein
MSPKMYIPFPVDMVSTTFISIRTKYGNHDTKSEINCNTKQSVAADCLDTNLRSSGTQYCGTTYTAKHGHKGARLMRVVLKARKNLLLCPRHRKPCK